MGYGSYLIWAVPDQPVFVDPRVELFSSAIWDDYFSMSRGQQVAELVDRYEIDRALLSRQEQPELGQALARLPEWRREYQDRWSEIWRRPNRVSGMSKP